MNNLIDISNAEYHADVKRIGSTGLGYIRRSPAHYYAAFLDPQRIIKPPTPAMQLGTYTHMAILEPERFNKKFICLNDADICSSIGGAKPRATSEYKKWLEDFKTANADKEIIAMEDFNTVISMRNAVWAKIGAAELLTDIQAEKTLLFTDTATGAMCKARPDGLKQQNDKIIIIEIKTTENASPTAFGRQVANYGYYNQAAFYVDAVRAVGLGDDVLHVFLAIEKEPPYESSLFYTPDEVLEYGRLQNNKDLQTYVNCLKLGVWDGYGDYLQPLQVPAWAFKQTLETF